MNVSGILLNNMAVSMLQRSCHSQGFETLHDAVTITRSLMRNEEQTPGHQQQLLTMALHRVASPLVTLACASQVDAGSHNDADHCGLRNIRSSHRMLIRIDTSDQDILSEDSHALTLGILMLNFGIAASLCGATRQGFAINLLACSIQILEALSEDIIDDPYTLMRVVFVSCVALEALLPLLSEEDAGPRREQLEALHELATTLDDSELFQDYTAAAAA
jgi:hypothetical protein